MRPRLLVLGLILALASCKGGGTTPGAPKPAASARPEQAAARGLTGVVLGPTAAILSNNSSGVLSNNGGAIISDVGGSFVAKWHLAFARDQLIALANAKVSASDLQGRPFTGVATRTDGAGRYRITMPGTATVIVTAVATVGAVQLTLAAIAAPQAGDTPIDPATTLAAKVLQDAIARGALAPAAVTPALAAALARRLEPAMNDRAVVAAVGLPAGEAAAVFGQMLAESPPLKAGIAQDAPAVANPPQPATTPAPTPRPAGSTSPVAPLPATPQPIAPPQPTTGPSPTPGTAILPYRVESFVGRGLPVGGLSHPTELALMPDGRIAVADTYHEQLRAVRPDGAVDVLAGDGMFGINDPARLSDPVAIAVDAAGTVYFSDVAGARVRSWQPGGALTLVAGGGAPGMDGEGAQAGFQEISGLALGPDGALYVADAGTHTIRRIDLADPAHPHVTTLAGGGAGFQDGQGTQARFFRPSHLCVAPTGEIYVSDTFNHAIRRVGPDGAVTTVAGGQAGYVDGQGTAARFIGPAGIAIDGGANLFVADNNNRLIRRVSRIGQVTTVAGNQLQLEADGPGANAGFRSPYGLVLDGRGSLFVSDPISNAIRKVDLLRADFLVTSPLPPGPASLADGAAAAARFSLPQGMAAGADGTLYVA
ncbi:MAG: hypothetical protein JWM80_2510, partial [Cyanobacteria bacterium RYN_339]|nr:hypothetical protein [Cyanobacteria bacterium RYN_339]